MPNTLPVEEKRSLGRTWYEIRGKSATPRLWIAWVRTCALAGGARAMWRMWHQVHCSAGALRRQPCCATSAGLSSPKHTWALGTMGGRSELQRHSVGRFGSRPVGHHEAVRSICEAWSAIPQARRSRPTPLEVPPVSLLRDRRTDRCPFIAGRVSRLAASHTPPLVPPRVPLVSPASPPIDCERFLQGALAETCRCASYSCGY